VIWSSFIGAVVAANYWTFQHHKTSTLDIFNKINKLAILLFSYFSSILSDWIARIFFTIVLHIQILYLYCLNLRIYSLNLSQMASLWWCIELMSKFLAQNWILTGGVTSLAGFALYFSPFSHSHSFQLTLSLSHTHTHTHEHTQHTQSHTHTLTHTLTHTTYT